MCIRDSTGEAGAIGAAMETLRVVKRRGKSTFIGLDAAVDLTYTSTTDESTRCHFCPNLCQRTFIDTKTPDGATSRYIAGFSCEKGTVESEAATVSYTHLDVYKRQDFHMINIQGILRKNNDKFVAETGQKQASDRQDVDQIATP